MDWRVHAYHVPHAADTPCQHVHPLQTWYAPNSVPVDHLMPMARSTVPTAPPVLLERQWCCPATLQQSRYAPSHAQLGPSLMVTAHVAIAALAVQREPLCHCRATPPQTEHVFPAPRFLGCRRLYPPATSSPVCLAMSARQAPAPHAQRACTGAPTTASAPRVLLAFLQPPMVPPAANHAPPAQTRPISHALPLSIHTAAAAKSARLAPT